MAALLEKIVTHSKIDASKLQRVKLVQHKLRDKIKQDDEARKTGSLSMWSVLHSLKASARRMEWTRLGSATTSS